MIVGWSMADHMRAELVVDSLQIAVARRWPAPGLMHDFDRGSQYISLGWPGRARCWDRRLDGLQGCAYDNAVGECVFATLKKELVHRRAWPTRRELLGEVFGYFEAFYSRSRRHSTLGYLTPFEFENKALGQSGERLAASRLAHAQEIE